MPDQELAFRNSSPMSFIQMEQDIVSLTSEIQDIYHKAYTIISRTKRTKQQRWFFHPKLVELRDQIRKAEPVLRDKLKNKYINHARRIRMKESEPIPINMCWNMVRKKEKPLTIDINGNHCMDEKIIADKFADHIANPK